MPISRAAAVCLACLLGATGCTESTNNTESSNKGSGEIRAQVRIVGSSTVYPFASYVAEEFGATTKYPTPIVESTGTGGGMKLFCAGTGMDTPDIVNASRSMTPGEYKRCQENGVTDITEFKFGLDGIVLAQDNSNPEISLTREQITLAVARKVPMDGELVPNPYETWSDIDPSLPDREIIIYGPPTTSGTRDAFEELVMAAATEKMPGYDEPYTAIRQDGAYIASGENDNLLVEKIRQNKEAFAIFGYSFLAENRDKIQAVSIEGVEPTPETISSGAYPVARSLFFYTKNSHFDKVKGMRGYVELFLSERMIGPNGLLTNLGLIPLPADKRAEMRQRLEKLPELTLADLREGGHESGQESGQKTGQESAHETGQ